MLISATTLVRDARNKGYAIGAFNTSNLEITQAIIEAAAAEKSPVIVQTTEKAVQYAGIEALYLIVSNLAHQVSIPVVLQLDHGKSYEFIKLAYKHNYTSLMFDGSKLPFSENIKITKKVVALARTRDISVEGELGVIAGQEDKAIAKKSYLTDSDEALEFVEETGVDMLAVSIGTAHGLPLPNEKIDFARLEEISEKVKIPLVLHGSSNTKEADFKKAIKLGVSKINIDTELRQAFTRGIKKVLRSKKIYDPREYLGAGREEVKKRVRELIRIFGSRGKA